MLTGVNGQPGWFLDDLGIGSGQGVVCVGRRPPPHGVGTFVHADLAAQGASDALPAAAGIVHMAPIWLLPRLMSRLAAPPERVIAFSSTSARTKAMSPDSRERAMAECILAAERDALAWAQAQAVRCVILRCTLVYGHPRAGAVAAMTRWIRRLRLAPVPANAGGLRQPVHARDLVRAVGALLREWSLPDGRYDAGGGEQLRFDEMIRRLFRASGMRPRILPVPAAAVRGSLRLARGLSLTGLTPGLVDRLAQDQVAEDNRLWVAAGVAPRPFLPPGGSGPVARPRTTTQW